MAHRMSRVRLGYAQFGSQLLRAAVAARLGDLEKATPLLRTAAEAAEANDNRLPLLPTRRRRGEIIGGAEGAALIAGVDDEMGNLGIRNPERMVEVYAPGSTKRASYLD